MAPKRKREEEKAPDLLRTTPKAQLFNELYAVFNDIGIATDMISIVLECLCHQDMSHGTLTRYVKRSEELIESISDQQDRVIDERNALQEVKDLIVEVTSQHDALQACFVDNSKDRLRELNEEYDRLCLSDVTDVFEERRIDEFWRVSAHAALPLDLYRFFGYHMTVVGTPCEIEVDHPDGTTPDGETYTDNNVVMYCIKLGGLYLPRGYMRATNVLSAIPPFRSPVHRVCRMD